MIKPMSMQRFTLNILDKDAPRAALLLAECGIVSPEVSALPAHLLPEYPSEAYAKIFYSAQTRLKKIQQRLSVVYPVDLIPKKNEVSTLSELEEINNRLGEIWTECSTLEEQHRIVAEERKHLENLTKILKIFTSLEIDLNRLQQTSVFLHLQIGALPSQNLSRLEKAITILPYHFLKVFHQSNELAYIMVAVLPEDKQNLQKLLQTADFHDFPLPPEFKDYPQKVQQNLEQASKERLQELALLEMKKQETAKKRAAELAASQAALRLAEPYASLADTLRGGRSGLTLLEGWIPRRETPRLQRVLAVNLNKRFFVDFRDPTAAEQRHAPTALSHSPFFTPFSRLVKNFGIPRYTEIDPTLLFTFSSILMFGVMFGDVGHGAVIAAAGWYFRARLQVFTLLFIAAGVSSMSFGALYGSVFGFEGVFFHPLWISPLSNPLLMLQVALAWGASFLFIACCLKLYNLWIEKQYYEVFLGSRGVAGVLFYLAGLWIVYRLASGSDVTLLESGLLVLPLGMISVFLWHELAATPTAEKMIVIPIEIFDFMINFISNTLSFMRVAAFSLNHVALALAVFAIANQLGAFGYWLTVIIGNLFIIILEGAIVSIQVLRLEYYEGFTHFFSGDGREFHPLTLKD